MNKLKKNSSAYYIYGRMILNKSMDTIIAAKKFPSQLIIFVPRTPFLQLTQQRCPR